MRIEESMASIELIKNTISRSKGNANQMYPVFFILGFGHFLYYLFNLIFISLIHNSWPGIRMSNIAVLGGFRLLIFIAAFVAFFILFFREKQERNRRIHILVGIGLFFIPISLEVVRIVFGFFNISEMNLVGLVFTQLYQNKSAIEVLIFCAFVLLLSYENHFNRAAITSVGLLVAYAFLIVLTEMVKINFLSAETSLLVLYTFLLKSIGYIAIGFVLMRRRKRDLERI